MLHSAYLYASIRNNEFQKEYQTQVLLQRCDQTLLASRMAPLPDRRTVDRNMGLHENLRKIKRPT